MKNKILPLFLLMPVCGVFAYFAFDAADAKAQVVPAGSISPLPSQDANYSRLRGVPYFYLEVTSGGTSPDEAELRSELRDLIELDLRRNNIAVRVLSPTVSEAETPVLRLNLKWERGSGRGDCLLELSVLDKVQIVRNREQINATIFEVRRPVNILTDQTAGRDIKGRTRDLLKEFCSGFRRAN
jgi:hypothetical protein